MNISFGDINICFTHTHAFLHSLLPSASFPAESHLVIIHQSISANQSIYHHATLCVCVMCGICVRHLSSPDSCVCVFVMFSFSAAVL